MRTLGYMNPPHLMLVTKWGHGGGMAGITPETTLHTAIEALLERRR